MKKLYLAVMAVASLFATTSCSDSFLEENVTAAASDQFVYSQDQIEGLVTAAYAAVGNDHYFYPFSLWPWGNTRSDDSKKGGRDESDIYGYHCFEVSEGINSSTETLDDLWYCLYKGVKRCNIAIRSLNLPENAGYANREQRLAEMYFLRGHFYYKLKQLWKFVPWITEEQIDLDNYTEIGNRTMSNDELWGKIITEFENAYKTLPETQAQVGRPTKYAAAAYLAKCYLWRAYTQADDTNVPSGINTADMQKALEYANVVVGSNKYGLLPNFAQLFLPTADGGIENSQESVWSIQFSNNDGTMFGRLNWSNQLNWPQGCGGCDFQKPSQNLVNAFKTVGGLPDDNFQQTDYTYNYVADASGKYAANANSEVDPRLYHTVAIPGLPYKYDKTQIFTRDWIRTIGVYGDYASLKECCSPSSSQYIKDDPFYATTTNQIELRYADIMLIKAECEIELNTNVADAIEQINKIRERAGSQESMSLIKDWAVNCNIATYPTTLNQEEARKALRWERRLEMAMECQRFFDLVRWGTAKEVLTAYYAKESSKSAYYKDAKFDQNHDEYMPIPYNQIFFAGGVEGVYKQNPGY